MKYRVLWGFTWECAHCTLSAGIRWGAGQVDTGLGAKSQVRAGDGALHVFSTQMVLVAVGAGEVAGDSAHSRNDVSQSTSLGEHSLTRGRLSR